MTQHVRLLFASTSLVFSLSAALKEKASASSLLFERTRLHALSNQISIGPGQAV